MEVEGSQKGMYIIVAGHPYKARQCSTFSMVWTTCDPGFLKRKPLGIVLLEQVIDRPDALPVS